ncbi:hypothetical protein [Gloeothece verrucosa]|uniref:hypothetical protein n=1 Tax=Gloeothece verrucosa TaxID=2546359 RepID=UPI001C1E4F47|nr:hypothetical protein [Gloeothece verrucosa]
MSIIESEEPQTPLEGVNSLDERLSKLEEQFKGLKMVDEETLRQIIKNNINLEFESLARTKKIEDVIADRMDEKIGSWRVRLIEDIVTQMEPQVRQDTEHAVAGFLSQQLHPDTSKSFLKDLIGTYLSAQKAENLGNEEEDHKARGISFAKTLPQLLSGHKTVTRRLWCDSYANTFIKYFEEQVIIPAYSKDLRAGGEVVGRLKLTQKPYKQSLAELSQEDVKAEGFSHLSPGEFIDRFFKGNPEQEVWVIWFEFLPNKPSEEQTQPDENLTGAELAKLLGVNKSTVSRWAKEGKNHGSWKYDPQTKRWGQERQS